MNGRRKGFVAVPSLILAAAWWLGSPLFLDRSDEQSSALASTTVVPTMNIRVEPPDVLLIELSEEFRFPSLSPPPALLPPPVPPLPPHWLDSVIEGRKLQSSGARED